MHQLREIRNLGFPVRFASTGSGKPWSLRKELEVLLEGSPSGVVTRGGIVRWERGKRT